MKSPWTDLIIPSKLILSWTRLITHYSTLHYQDQHMTANVLYNRYFIIRSLLIPSLIYHFHGHGSKFQHCTFNTAPLQYGSFAIRPSSIITLLHYGTLPSLHYYIMVLYNLYYNKVPRSTHCSHQRFTIPYALYLTFEFLEKHTISVFHLWSTLCTSAYHTIKMSKNGPKFNIQQYIDFAIHQDSYNMNAVNSNIMDHW